MGAAVTKSQRSNTGIPRQIGTTMTSKDPKNAAALIVAGLKKAGIDFVATLPDEKNARSDPRGGDR